MPKPGKSEQNGEVKRAGYIPEGEVEVLVEEHKLPGVQLGPGNPGTFEAKKGGEKPLESNEVSFEGNFHHAEDCVKRKTRERNFRAPQPLLQKVFRIFESLQEAFQVAQATSFQKTQKKILLHFEPIYPVEFQAE